MLLEKTNRGQTSAKRKQLRKQLQNTVSIYEKKMWEQNRI